MLFVACLFPLAQLTMMITHKGGRRSHNTDLLNDDSVPTLDVLTLCRIVLWSVIDWTLLSTTDVLRYRRNIDPQYVQARYCRATSAKWRPPVRLTNEIVEFVATVKCVSRHAGEKILSLTVRRLHAAPKCPFAPSPSSSLMRVLLRGGDYC